MAKRTVRSNINDLEYLTEIEVPVLYPISLATLRTDRKTRALGIPFIRIGRKICYSKKAIEEWLTTHTVQ